MTPSEMIAKYQIRSRGDGTIMVPQGKKLSAAEIAAVQAAKPAILAEFESREKLAAQKREIAQMALAEENQRVILGKESITLNFRDGEYLGGYVATDLAAQKVLIDLGLACYVEGWGYKVDTKLVQALGTSFSYSQAVEFIRPIREAQAAAAAAKLRQREEKLAQARETGERVELGRWSEPCSDPREECDIDNVVEYVLPDGSTKVFRAHTW